MRHPFLTASLIAALLLPLACFAQDDEDDEDMDAMAAMMLSGEGLPEMDMGTQDNGWFFKRENGLCRMYSFNDPLVIQADPSDPLGTRFQFGMIDREIPQAHGTQVQMILALRGNGEAKFEGHDAVVVASHDMKNYGYLMAVPLGGLVAQYPNGFELVLMDKNEKPILKSDTRGTTKHLAELAACGKN